MSIWDKIKSAYNKADKALGGYLPGSSTPEEVAKSKVTTIAPESASTGHSTASEAYNNAKTTNIASTEKVSTEPTETSNMENLERGEGDVSTTIATEKLPYNAEEAEGYYNSGQNYYDTHEYPKFGDISNIKIQDVAGGLGLAAVGAGAVQSLTAAASWVKTALSAGTGVSKASITAKATELGLDATELEEVVQSKLLQQAAADILKVNAGKVFLGITKKQLLTTAATVATGIGGAAGLTSWLASDNMIGVAGMTISKIETRYQAGQITKDEASEQVANQVDIIEKAQKTIDFTTMINPLMWPFRNTFMDNAENALETAKTTQSFIETLPETTNEYYERIREESEEKEMAWDELQKANEEGTVAEEYATAEEQELLFRAIKKRNLGKDLTEEEWAILIKFGLDTIATTTSDWDDTYSSSSFSFGLF